MFKLHESLWVHISCLNYQNLQKWIVKNLYNKKTGLSVCLIFFEYGDVFALLAVYVQHHELIKRYQTIDCTEILVHRRPLLHGYGNQYLQTWIQFWIQWKILLWICGTNSPTFNKNNLPSTKSGRKYIYI